MKNEHAGRIKVFCIFESFTFAGGVEQMGLVLAKFLEKDKFDLNFCCLNDKNGPFGTKIENLGFHIYDFKILCNLNVMNIAKIIWKLYRLFKKERPQVVQTIDMKPNLLGRVAAKLAGVPVIIATEVLEPDQKESRKFYSLGEKVKTLSWPIMNTLNVWLHHYSDKVIVLSERARNYREKEINSGKLEKIYSLFDLESFSKQRDTTMNNTVLKRHQPTIAVVARLDHAKGHVNLIKAMPKVLAIFPAIRLLLIGEGPYKETLKKTVSDMNLIDTVIFAGYVESLPETLSSATMFVLPTLSEGCPLTIMEAMALELPVIASSVGAIPELVLNKHNGILVPPGDPNALADAIIHLLSHPDEAKKMGQKGKERIHAIFHPKKGIEQIESLYERLVFEKNPENHHAAAEQ
jgi:glycosyltransferase involved in cell wall biosynthesis